MKQPVTKSQLKDGNSLMDFPYFDSRTVNVINTLSL